jgi:hypothetical protein
MRFQVLMVTSMKMTVFWGVVSCSLVEIYQCFRDAASTFRAMSKPHAEKQAKMSEVLVWPAATVSPTFSFATSSSP